MIGKKLLVFVSLLIALAGCSGDDEGVPQILVETKTKLFGVWKYNLSSCKDKIKAGHYTSPSFNQTNQNLFYT